MNIPFQFVKTNRFIFGTVNKNVHDFNKKVRVHKSSFEDEIVLAGEQPGSNKMNK